MDDTELENRIKNSADRIEVKDFSARFNNVCEIAGKDALAEKKVVFIKQPAAQTAGGNTESRRLRRIIVLAVCLFAILAAVLATVVAFSLRGATAMDDAPELSEAASSDSALEYTNDSNNGEAEIVISAIYAGQSEFYAAFESENIAIADFTVYTNVTYYLYYTQYGALAGGNAQFELQNTAVTVEFYIDEYSDNFGYINSINGVCYAIFGDLSDDLFDSVLENIKS